MSHFQGEITMSSKMCVVTRVEVPRVAHESGQFVATVIWAQKIWLKQKGSHTPIQGVDYLIKKQKREVFVNYRPVIGSSIECQFV